MKRIYLVLLGVLCSLPMAAHSPELVDRNPTESDWYGMLVGKTFLLESTARSAYPLIGEFDAATNQLKISKKYVGRDWRGRYFFIEPYTVQNSKLVSAKWTFRDITICMA